MLSPARKKVIGWCFFDWASQPFYTLGLTFIFGPYFAAIAAEHYASGGLAPETANAHAQALWSRGQMITGFLIAVSAPLLGAFADTTGRKLPWIALFSLVYIVGSALLWQLSPDGSGLFTALIAFCFALFAAESALNFVNAYLPEITNRKDIGRVSGAGASFGYLGGFIALILTLTLFTENAAGVTLLGRAPILGLDPDAREGTRSVGPVIAIWYALFMIPFFLWVRDKPRNPGPRPNAGATLREFGSRLGRVMRQPSLRNFLIGSMLYRDALNALYAFGGVYAVLVLGWSVVQVGVFGITGVIAAALVTALAGHADTRFGPRPVLMAAIAILTLVSCIIIGMSRDGFFWFAFPEGSALPDIIFYCCGAAIGGAGGALFTASRSLMVRHTHAGRATEAFGLYALSGKATAFLAPAAIGAMSVQTGDVRLGFTPVIVLFLLGMLLLSKVDPEGVASDDP